MSDRQERNIQTDLPVPNRLLTAPECAELLGVTVQALAAARCLGRWTLPYVKVGRLVRYRRDDVEAFISRHTVGGERSSDPADA